MGADGHTASLFAGTAAASERRHWVVACREPQTHTWRVTLTLPLLNAARAITFLVAGANKAACLRAVLDHTQVIVLPARLIQPQHGSLHWIVDATAAASLGANGSLPLVAAAKPMRLQT
jgi:6-phosphogluconolactonase